MIILSPINMNSLLVDIMHKIRGMAQMGTIDSETASIIANVYTFKWEGQVLQLTTTKSSVPFAIISL